MTIRRAEPADRADVIRMMRAFHEAARPPFAFSAAHVDRMFAASLDLPNALLLVLDADGGAYGLLAATAIDHPFAVARVALEHAWWIDPPHRGRSALAMLREYEAWALAQGCTAIGMAALAGSDAGRLYQRAGFRPMETNYVKAL